MALVILAEQLVPAREVAVQSTDRVGPSGTNATEELESHCKNCIEVSWFCICVAMLLCAIVTRFKSKDSEVRGKNHSSWELQAIHIWAKNTRSNECSMVMFFSVGTWTNSSLNRG